MGAISKGQTRFASRVLLERNARRRLVTLPRGRPTRTRTTGQPCNHLTQSFRRSCMHASACVQRLQNALRFGDKSLSGNTASGRTHLSVPIT
jgi:hypothetical protein